MASNEGEGPGGAGVERAEAALPAVVELLGRRTGREPGPHQRPVLLARLRHLLEGLAPEAAEAEAARLLAEPERVLALAAGLGWFFRDPAALGALAERALPELSELAAREGALRIWVPCAGTGEELYTLAILAREALDRSGRPSLPLQVFGTGSDPVALEVAQRGLYPETIDEDVGPARLARFFVAKGDERGVGPRLRRACGFFEHDMAGDAPLSSIHLVCCRDALGHLARDARKAALDRLVRSLRPGGFLLLGPGDEAPPRLHELGHGLHRGGFGPAPTPLPARAASPVASLAGLVVGRDGRVLLATQGSDHLLERDGAREALEGALAEALESGQSARRELPGRERGRGDGLVLEASPLAGAAEGAGRFLVTVSAGADRDLEAELGRLRAEIRAGRDQGGASVEELRVAAEELRAANEEVDVANEELRTVNEALVRVNLELAESRDELTHAHAELQNLVRSSGAAVLFVDLEGRLRSFTPAASLVWNVVPGELGRPLSELTHRATAMPPLPDLEEIERAGEPVVDEGIETLDGRVLERRVRAYRDGEGRPTGLAVSFVDVTALARSRAEARRSEALLAEAMRVGRAHAFDYDAATGLVARTEMAAEVFGLPPEEAALGPLEAFLEAVHPEDRPGFEALLGGLSPEAPGYTATYRFVRPDGGTVWLETSGTGRFDREGRLVGLSGLTAEVTDRIEPFRRVEEEKRRLDLLTGATSDLLALLDGEGRLVYANRSAAEAIGGEVEGRTLGEAAQGWLPPTVLGDIGRVLETGERVRGEGTHEGPAGPTTYEYVLDPVRDEAGRVSGLVATARDVTDQRTKQAELLEARERLARQEKLALVGSLAAAVAHELRNPLGAIKNSGYLLKVLNPEPTADQAEALAILATEIDRAERIIRSLLEFAWPKPADRRRVVAAELVREALDRSGLPAEIRLEQELDEGLEVSVDPDQLVQILAALVTNAVQAMAGRGRLAVRARRADGEVLVEVEDSGPGVPEPDLEHLFEPLFTTKAKGLGLGLAIAKELVGRNLGRLEVASRPGEGATFRLRLRPP